MEYTPEQVVLFALIQKALNSANWFSECDNGKLIVSFEYGKMKSIVRLSEDKNKERI